MTAMRVPSGTSLNTRVMAERAASSPASVTDAERSSRIASMPGPCAVHPGPRPAAAIRVVANPSDARPPSERRGRSCRARDASRIRRISTTPSNRTAMPSRGRRSETDRDPAPASTIAASRAPGGGRGVRSAGSMGDGTAEVDRSSLSQPSAEASTRGRSLLSARLVASSGTPNQMPRVEAVSNTATAVCPATTATVWALSGGAESEIADGSTSTG